MSDVKHTALPWTLDYGQVHSPDGEVVAKRGSDANILPTERDANMRYIVTACNAYPQLLAALKVAQAIINKDIDLHDEDMEQINAALAQAQGDE